MSLFLRVIEPHEVQEILEFETRKLKEQIPDETERMLQSWISPWRPEALTHYVTNGWSFLARDEERKTANSPNGELVGYFIAQPLLFFDGQTQSLWVEHVQFSSLEARDQLCDLAYRLGKDKHLQRVYFPNTPALSPTLKSMKAQEWSTQTLYFKTTKA
jgi:hypothetical protein